MEVARGRAGRAVCDYISSMTDRYAIGVFEDLFVPKNFSMNGRD